MANLPQLTPEQITAAFPALSEVGFVGQGGQKIVFRVRIEGQSYALKFALLPQEIDSENEEFVEVKARAKREVEIMRECTSPYMVKLGPIGLEFCEIAGQSLLYFSEEFIDGEILSSIRASGTRLNAPQIVTLGIQIVSAVQELWNLGKIHRDVKRSDIMQRNTGDYVLLDAGLAFDVVGESLSAGFLVGTPPYFSPEQSDYQNRRVLDFRSDIFSLGVTLYEMSTGRHPFWVQGDNSITLFRKISGASPPAPSSLNPEIPPELDRIILRMMGKSPHLRYRKCEHLITALVEVQRG